MCTCVQEKVRSLKLRNFDTQNSVYSYKEQVTSLKLLHTPRIELLGLLSTVWCNIRCSVAIDVGLGLLLEGHDLFTSMYDFILRTI